MKAAGYRTGAIAGALLALTIGWPLIGAAEALAGRAMVGDGENPARIAAEGIVAAHEGWIRWALGDEPRETAPAGQRDCLTLLGAGVFAPHPGATAGVAADLAGVIDRSRRTRDARFARRVAVDALVALPGPPIGHPLLGALAGCIGGSLLSAVCDRWASRRIGDALRKRRAELIDYFRKSADAAQQQACRAWEGASGSVGSPVRRR